MSADPKTCKKAFKAIKKLYVQLNKLTPDAKFKGQLYQAGVLTFDEERNIQSADELWTIIQTSLQINMITKFDKLLEVMDGSENFVIKGLAQQLSDAAERPIPKTSEKKQKSGVELRVDRGNGGGAFEMFELLNFMECVCRIENSQCDKGATGFVAKVTVSHEEVHFIITCHHAIPDETTAKSSSFRFNHIDDQYEAGRKSGTDLFDMTASKWFWTNKNLNYTAVRLNKDKLSNVRYAQNEDRKMEILGIPLSSTTVDVPLDEGHIFTIIQQTPTMKLCEGGCKQKKDVSSAMLKYKMNTSKGSGGAPIFKEHNGKLRLIAIHIGNEKTAKYNCGVRMSEVLKDIKGEEHSTMPVNDDFILE